MHIHTLSCRYAGTGSILLTDLAIDSFNQALLCVPVEERGDYRSLVGHANLLVEQLLINRKVHVHVCIYMY